VAVASSGTIDPVTGGLDLKMDLEFIPSDADLAVIRAGLQDTSRLLCDATDHRVWVRSVDISATPPSDFIVPSGQVKLSGSGVRRADIRYLLPYDGTLSRANTQGGGLGSPVGRVVIYKVSDFPGLTLAHELGHLVLGLGDSYEEFNPPGLDGCNQGPGFDQSPDSKFDSWEPSINNSLMFQGGWWGLPMVSCVDAVTGLPRAQAAPDLVLPNPSASEAYADNCGAGLVSRNIASELAYQTNFDLRYGDGSASVVGARPPAFVIPAVAGLKASSSLSNVGTFSCSNPPHSQEEPLIQCSFPDGSPPWWTPQIYTFQAPRADGTYVNRHLAVVAFPKDPIHWTVSVWVLASEFEGGASGSWKETARFDVGFADQDGAVRAESVNGVPFGATLPRVRIGSTSTASLFGSGTAGEHGQLAPTGHFVGEGEGSAIELRVALDQLIQVETSLSFFSEFVPGAARIKWIGGRFWDAKAMRWFPSGVYSRYPQGSGDPPVKTLAVAVRADPGSSAADYWSGAGSLPMVPGPGCSARYWVGGYKASTGEFESTKHRIGNVIAVGNSMEGFAVDDSEWRSLKNNLKRLGIDTEDIDPFSAPNPDDSSCIADPSVSCPETITGPDGTVRANRGCLPPVKVTPATAAQIGAIPDEMVIVLDRSGSMATPEWPNTTRLDYAKAAARLVMDLEASRAGTGKVKVGILPFSSHDLVSPPVALEDLPDTAIAASFTSSIDALTPSGLTWMGDAMANAISSFSPASSSGSINRAIFLVTDGENNGTRDPITEIANAAKAGIKTYPIPIGTGTFVGAAAAASASGGWTNPVSSSTEQVTALVESLAVANGDQLVLPRQVYSLTPAKVVIRAAGVTQTSYDEGSKRQLSFHVEPGISRLVIAASPSSDPAAWSVGISTLRNGSLLSAGVTEVTDPLFKLVTVDSPSSGDYVVTIANPSTLSSQYGTVAIVAERLGAAPSCDVTLDKSVVHEGESVGFQPLVVDELAAVDASFTSWKLNAQTQVLGGAASSPTAGSRADTHRGTVPTSELPGRGAYFIETECHLNPGAELVAGENFNSETSGPVRHGPKSASGYTGTARTSFFFDTDRLPPLSASDADPNGDADRDGLPNSAESQGDSDGDGWPDWRDQDSDNDDLPDQFDPHPTVPDGVCLAQPAPIACCSDPTSCPALEGYALYATQEVKVNDRAIVRNGDGTSARVGAAGVDTPTSVEIGVDARTGRIDAGADVFLRDRSHALGGVWAKGTIVEQNLVEVSVGRFAHQPLQMLSLGQYQGNSPSIPSG